jgi:hypothetical protein
MTNFMQNNKEVKDFYDNKFDFNSQIKKNYNGWVAAFSKAVKTRGKNNCFIALSSGYDSGALACELEKQKIPFGAYAFRNNEDAEIIDIRIKTAQSQGTNNGSRLIQPIQGVFKRQN